MPTGTVSQWMISAQSLGLKEHSLVWELAEVYLFRILKVFDIFNFPSACCAYFHQV